MFAPVGSEAPFDTAGNNGLRPGAAEAANQNNNLIFNQDLLMATSMQA